MDLSFLTTISTTVNEGLSGAYVPSEDLEGKIASLSVRVVLASALILIISTLIAVIFKNQKRLKSPLFFIMAFVMLASTLFLSVSTVYVNLKSDSGGPVHWHADFEIWACGNQLELKDPYEFLSNKIGTPTLHEHDDQRIHLEGVVIDDSRDASLGKFFNVIGGAVTAGAMIVPLNNTDQGPTFENDVDGDGLSSTQPNLLDSYIEQAGPNNRIARLISGNYCGDTPAELQIFVYRINQDGKTYTQEKISDPVTYSITQSSTVPPGDCIIFEFGPARDQTDKLCSQYGVRDDDRCEEFGVESDKKAVCEIHQAGYSHEPTTTSEEELETQSSDEHLTDDEMMEEGEH